MSTHRVVTHIATPRFAGVGVEIGLGSVGVEIGSASVVGNMPTRVNEEGDAELNVESAKDEEVVESGSDIDLGFDIDLESDDLKSLDGCDGEEDEGEPSRKFIKTKYHEFNPSRDIKCTTRALVIEAEMAGDSFETVAKTEAGTGNGSQPSQESIHTGIAPKRKRKQTNAALA
ncbi:hypothetical protein LWI28_018182 [Acer negundo]|uniref:Uncharacterized protein n=1 Tax=Acer negundo TaxID=4023 RepID=A0AAD5IQW2_ACENE|nr:hypothetical protein LWI28_018182 [Acer negundo]